MKEPIATEKVTDASLTRSIISSVIGIVLCMACLFGTTWAWYSLSVTSGVSETFGANFDFTVEITDTITPDVNGVYTFAGGTHTVKLTKAGTAEKGFCKVVATKDGEEAETTTYYIVDFTGDEPISFTVKGSGTLKLIPMLGTPASGYTEIPEGGIALTLDPVAMTPPPKTETQPEEPVLPTGGETETSEGPTTGDEQTTPPDETPANPDTTEQEPPTEQTSETPGSSAEQPTETTDP